MSLGVVAHEVDVALNGTSVLRGVSLAVDAGGWLSVVGPNGAGKTTLLRAMTGLVPFEGDIAVGGRPLEHYHRRERAQTIALVPQNPIVPPGMSVADYLLLGRTPHIPFLGTERSVDLAIVSEVLEQLELEGFAARRLSTLSGGELQRVILGRALAQAAPVLLLDEPTTSLDVGHQQEVLELVDTLRRARGLTVVSTMHDLTLAGQYGERIVMLDAGRVVASGAPEEVLTEEHLSLHYRARVRVLRDEQGIVVVPLRSTIEGAS